MASPVDDARVCALIYEIAADTEVTHDRTQWPDVLAFRWPVTALKPLVRLMGISDAALYQTVIGACRALGTTPNADDRAALRNTISAALAEQHRRDDA